MDISVFKEQYNDYVISMRREFHKIPEISLKEYNTSKKIRVELDKLGIPYRIAGETGIIADIKGGLPGKTVALRADIDALAVTEKTGVEYTSQNDGFMHACGHDAHIAMLLGAIQILWSIRESLKGNIRIMFEPAEEIAKGANLMIANGAMEGVDTVFGMHVWSDVAAGKISVEGGPRMASADFFYTHINGKSCHGSMPQQGIDAIIAGCSLVQNYQTIISREISPLNTAVITVGEFKAGEQANVIAGHAYLSGTTRAFDDETRDKIIECMKRVNEYTAKTFRVEIDMDYQLGSPAVINDYKSAEIAQGAVKKLFGEDMLCYLEKTAGGENFSEYLHLVPGAFAFIGVRNEELDAVYSQHSCFYKMDESVLINGSLLAVQYALDFMEENS